MLINLWEGSFFLFFLYTFFVQNAFKSISGILMVFCGVLALFAFVDVLNKRNGVIRFNSMALVGLFVAVSFLSSLLISVDVSLSMQAGLRMIEYLIIACSLCSFLTHYPSRFFAILRYIWLSVTLLCVFVLFFGEEITAAGGVGLEALNVNLLSTFIFIQIFAAFALIVKAKMPGKILYGLSVALSFFVQVLTASRRGFIVAYLFILAAVFFCLIPRYTSQRSAKRFLLILLCFALVLVLLFYGGNYILEETALGERFAGYFNSGDKARAKYREVALEQFAANPVLGVGLNGLTSIMGVYSHSLYYETIACTGLIGTLFLLVALLSVLEGLWKTLRQNKSKGTVSRYRLQTKLPQGEVKGEADPDGAYISKLTLYYFFFLLVSGVAVTMIYDFYFYISLAIIVAVSNFYHKKTLPKNNGCLP